MNEKAISWTFYGYATQADGRIVQDWFDGLSADERDEAEDTLAYLRHLHLNQWKYPRFEPLGDGLSEVRFKVASLNLTVRIYGMFWPAGERFAYTFLFGGNKKVKNDMKGKREAKRRKQLLENGDAAAYEFKFTKQSYSEATKGKVQAIPIR